MQSLAYCHCVLWNTFSAKIQYPYARCVLIQKNFTILNVNVLLNTGKHLFNVSSTDSTLCAQPCYCQTVETHSCVSASCQVFAIGDFIRQSCLPRRKNASLQVFVELTLFRSFHKWQIRQWIRNSHLQSQVGYVGCFIAILFIVLLFFGQ